MLSMIRKGSKVKYIGESSWAYTNGEIYEVYGYDEELDAYAVMSNVDELYAVGEAELEEISEYGTGNECSN